MTTYFKYSLLAIFLLFSCSNSSKNTEVIQTLSDLELIEKVQKDAFKYFWHYAHFHSKLARERLHEDNLSFDENTIAIGGSGFGFLNILLGIENQFITRSEGVNHLETALNFLENTDRFHGAWPHWIDGNSGKTIPFSTLDNGGDLIETALLSQALICIREYFKNGSTREQELAQKADILWQGVEWNWYTKNENVLYWHWSPDYQWQINLPIQGYNEGLIAYILAASSPTYPIKPEVYHDGWARNGAIINGTSKFNIPIIFNHNNTNNHVGPLFWAHYSYLALDPRGLTDTYADYWNVVKNHTQIIYQHCIENPNQYTGYNEKNWGLTASYTRNPDGSVGYTAHAPENDKGVITPTAALSSIVYTPEASLQFLRYLYEEKQHEYIGIAGPYDAFSIHYQWKTNRYLAIDQGTIGPMMENYRSQLFWNLFMNAPEIRNGLQKLGFSSSQHN